MTNPLQVLEPATWLMPRVNRWTMDQAVEQGILDHYIAHPKAVEALPEPFRTKTLNKIKKYENRNFRDLEYLH